MQTWPKKPGWIRLNFAPRNLLQARKSASFLASSLISALKLKIWPENWPHLTPFDLYDKLAIAPDGNKGLNWDEARVELRRRIVLLGCGRARLLHSERDVLSSSQGTLLQRTSKLHVDQTAAIVQLASDASDVTQQTAQTTRNSQHTTPMNEPKNDDVDDDKDDLMCVITRL